MLPRVPKKQPSTQREEPPPDICCLPCKALKYSWAALGRWGCHLPSRTTDRAPWATAWDTYSLGGPEQVLEPSGGFPICKVGRITSLVLLTCQGLCEAS